MYKSLAWVGLGALLGFGAARVFPSNAESESSSGINSETSLSALKQVQDLKAQLQEAKLRLGQLQEQSKTFQVLAKREAKELEKLKAQESKLQKHADSMLAKALSSDLAPKGSLSSPNQEDEVDQEADEHSKGTPLMQSVEKLKALDGGRRMKAQVDAALREVLADHPSKDELQPVLKEKLRTYHQQKEAIDMMVLDPTVPLAEVHQKLQSLHEDTLQELSLDVEYDKAEQLLLHQGGGDRRGVLPSLTRQYRKLKLSEDQELELQRLAQEVAQAKPELSFFTHGRGGGIRPVTGKTSLEELGQRRDFLMGSQSVSEIIIKAGDLKTQAQQALLEQSRNVLSLSEADEKKVQQGIEQSRSWTQRSAQFIQAMESDPAIFKGLSRLHETMGEMKRPKK